MSTASDGEGFSNAVLECMLAGCAVVPPIRRAAATAKLITDGRGWLTGAGLGDAAALRCGMTRLITDLERAGRLVGGAPHARGIGDPP